MKLYYYDENGYYRAMSEAFLDPLETELQGKEVWLIPPHATTAAAARTALGCAPAYTYSTTDLTAGSSALTTGTLYIVYE